LVHLSPKWLGPPILSRWQSNLSLSPKKVLGPGLLNLGEDLRGIAHADQDIGATAKSQSMAIGLVASSQRLDISS
jgi:hypothetical protein